MNATERRRGLAMARAVTTALATLLIISALPSRATAAEPAAGMFRETATMTVEQTATVTETVVIGGYTGYGEATATASATATRTEDQPSQWEAYYWANFYAWWDAVQAALKKAQDQARPIAKQRAEADANAQIAAAAKPQKYTATMSAEQTATVNETVVIQGFTGYGSATATASATATRTEERPTAWEAYYWATFNAWWDAVQAALTKAQDQARPIARQRAEADALAQVAEAAKPKKYTATMSSGDQTATVQETVVIDGYTGYGTASATASATATRTEERPTEWEAYYWATFNAWWDAVQAALVKAQDIARPIARERAEADARAQIAAANAPKTYTATMTVEQTVTIRESHTIGDVVGHGEATSTKSATKTVSHTAATMWEAKYYAETEATQQATAAAKAAATEEARAQALVLAKADAERQVQENGSGGTGGTTDCGPQVLKSNGTPWTCTFVDDFRGTSLDRDTWVPQLTSQSSFQHAEECFVDDPRTISVGDGVLKLTTQRLEEPMECESPSGDYESTYLAGQVSTDGKFKQTYGRFQFRAKVTDVSKKGLHSALWMWPDDDSAYGGRPHSGELDIAEIFSQYPDRAVPMLHYDAPLGLGGSGRTNTECELDPTQWNTYTAEWTNRDITITYNGDVCLKHTWNALAPLIGSQPFDKPFFLVMTQTIGSGTNAIDPADPPAGASLLVDYVRVWK